jgi:hypothetical protein
MTQAVSYRSCIRFDPGSVHVVNKVAIGQGFLLVGYLGCPLSVRIIPPILPAHRNQHAAVTSRKKGNLPESNAL